MSEDPNPNPEPNPDPNPNPDPAPNPSPDPDPKPEGDPQPLSYDDVVGKLEGDKADYAKRFKSVDDLIDGALNMRRELSKRPKVPGDDATDEEKAEYRKAQGVPEEAKAYEVKFPDGYELPEEVNTLLDGVKVAAHENNLPQGVLQGFVDAYVKQEKELQDKQAQDIENSAAEATDELRKDWKGDYEKNLNVAKRARETFGDDALNEAMDTIVPGTSMKLGDFPPLARLFHKIGARMGEDGVLAPVSVDDRQSIQSQIDQIKKENPVFSAGYNDPRTQAKLEALYSQLHGGT